MQKTVFALFGAALGLVIGIGVGSFVLPRPGAPLGIASRNAASEAAMAITDHWDEQQLISRESPDLARAAPDDKIYALFGTLRRLGARTGIDACRGKATAVVNRDGSETDTADYSCPGHFQAGEGSIEIAVVKAGDAWKISGFQIVTTALGQPQK